MEIQSGHILMAINSRDRLYQTRLYSICIPEEWHLSEEDETVSFANEVDRVAIVVTTFEGDIDNSDFRASSHLHRYLDRSDLKEVKIHELSDRVAKASYVDEDNVHWEVGFWDASPYILLATLNVDPNLPEDKIGEGREAFDSIRLMQ
jgi:hypothetical protein